MPLSHDGHAIKKIAGTQLRPWSVIAEDQLGELVVSPDPLREVVATGSMAAAAGGRSAFFELRAEAEAASEIASSAT